MGTNSANADLTDGEKQIVGLLATGETTNGIAKRLVISNTTTRDHIQNNLVKLGAHNRLEAVANALSNKLIEPAIYLKAAPRKINPDFLLAVPVPSPNTYNMSAHIRCTDCLSGAVCGFRIGFLSDAQIKSWRYLCG